jgi:hypothetical protein
MESNLVFSFQNFLQTLCILLIAPLELGLVFHWSCFFIFLLMFYWSFCIYFLKLLPFHIIPFQCCHFFQYSKLVVLNFDVVFRFDFSAHSNVWNLTFLLSQRCWMHVSTSMHLNIKVVFQQLSKPLKVNGIHN